MAINMSICGNGRITHTQNLVTAEDNFIERYRAQHFSHRGWEKYHFGVVDAGHDAILAAGPSGLTPAARTTSADSSPQPQVCVLAY